MNFGKIKPNLTLSITKGEKCFLLIFKYLENLLYSDFFS